MFFVNFNVDKISKGAHFINSLGAFSILDTLLRHEQLQRSRTTFYSSVKDTPWNGRVFDYRSASRRRLRRAFLSTDALFFLHSLPAECDALRPSRVSE